MAVQNNIKGTEEAISAINSQIKAISEASLLCLGTLGRASLPYSNSAALFFTRRSGRNWRASSRSSYKAQEENWLQLS